jgi:hypothetical protein
VSLAALRGRRHVALLRHLPHRAVALGLREHGIDGAHVWRAHGAGQWSRALYRWRDALPCGL